MVLRRNRHILARNLNNPCTQHRSSQEGHKACSRRRLVVIPVRAHTNNHRRSSMAHPSSSMRGQHLHHQGNLQARIPDRLRLATDNLSNHLAHNPTIHSPMGKHHQAATEDMFVLTCDFCTSCAMV